MSGSATDSRDEDDSPDAAPEGASDRSDDATDAVTNRRTLLRAVATGATGAGLYAGTVSGRRDAGSSGVALADATDGGPLSADGIRPVPVRGGCDAAVGDDACGDDAVGLYDHDDRIGLGRHSYQLEFQGVPLSAFGESFDAGQYAVQSGLVQRIPPPPPSAGPNWGPYRLLIPGSALSFDATEDLAAPLRLVPENCEVPPECQSNWCDAVERTVEGLEARSRALQQAVTVTGTKVYGDVFTATVQKQAIEPAVRAQLRGKINVALAETVTEIRTRMAQHRPSVDLDGTCGNCPACVQSPRAHRVRTWDLRLFERSSATATHDNLESWGRHALRATIRLEPASVAGPKRLGERLGGPMGGALGDLLGALGGFASAVGRVADGGVPSRRAWIGKPVRASAWRDSGYVAHDTDGRDYVAMVHEQGNGSSDFAKLVVDFDAGTYHFQLPKVPVSGQRLQTTLRGVSQTDVEADVGYGDAIARRAQADAEGGNGSGGANASATGAGASAAHDDKPYAQFELDESDACGSRLSGGVDLDLDGHPLVPLVTSPGSASASVPGLESQVSNPDVEGSASLRWRLVPREFEGTDMHSVGCQ